MPGHMGDVRVTVRNVAVAQVDVANNLLLVGGAVPGARNGFVLVRTPKK
jgi:large subunit ribosomal protein L3